MQEIVHGTDGPNAVIATALHESLPEGRRKVLAFADSRQGAAFFAWYAQDSYEKLRDRNFLLRAIRSEAVNEEGLSVEDLKSRLYKQYAQAGLFKSDDTEETRGRNILTSILQESLTEEKRLSLSGVGLVRWFVALPEHFIKLDDLIPLQEPPWNFNDDELYYLLMYLLNEMRLRRAMELPTEAETPNWKKLSPYPQWAYTYGQPRSTRNVSQWGGAQSAVVKHFLYRLLANSKLSDEEKHKRNNKTYGSCVGSII